MFCRSGPVWRSRIRSKTQCYGTLTVVVAVVLFPAWLMVSTVILWAPLASAVVVSKKLSLTESNMPDVDAAADQVV